MFGKTIKLTMLAHCAAKYSPKSAQFLPKSERIHLPGCSSSPSGETWGSPEVSPYAPLLAPDAAGVLAVSFLPAPNSQNRLARPGLNCCSVALGFRAKRQPFCISAYVTSCIVPDG